MEYLDIDTINALESGPNCLRNYLTFLCQKDPRVRNIFKNNNKDLKNDFKNIREKLDIGRGVSSIEFARRIKEYGFYSEMIITDTSDISKHKDSFPLFACLKNKNNETIYLYVSGISAQGILVKDEKFNDAFIYNRIFEKAFNKRAIVIKDYSGFIKKYGSKADLQSYIDKNYDINDDDALEAVGAIFEIIGLFLSK